MSLIEKNEILKAVETTNELYFRSKGSYEFAFLCKVINNYGYLETLTASQQNFDSDPLVKRMQGAISQGLSSVPILGDALGVINIFGWDFDLFKYLNESNSAQSVLWHQRRFFGILASQGKTSRAFYNNVKGKIQKLENARPKCGVPTEGCAKEHSHYTRRAKLFTACLANLFGACNFLRTCSEGEFEDWKKNLFYKTNLVNQYAPPPPKVLGVPVTAKTSVAGLGLVGALIFMMGK